MHRGLCIRILAAVVLETNVRPPECYVIEKNGGELFLGTNMERGLGYTIK